VFGLTIVPPFDDDGFDEADWLADALAFTLADDDALFLGAAEALTEGEDTTAACVGAGLVQVGFGGGWTVFLTVPPDVELVLGLGLSDTVEVAVGVPPGLSLELTLGLGLGLGLAEALALALELAVLPPLWLPLDDVAGAVVFPAVLLAGLVLVAVTDCCVDGDAQELGVL
jgi:hypothetical protein